MNCKINYCYKKCCFWKLANDKNHE